MRLGQALVFRHQPRGHIAGREHLDARANVLLQQPHDDAQAPPGEIRQRLVDPGARDLRVQLGLHGLVYRRRAATESCGSPCRRASKGLNSTAGSALASNSAAGSRRQASTPDPTA